MLSVDTTVRLPARTTTLLRDAQPMSRISITDYRTQCPLHTETRRLTRRFFRRDANGLEVARSDCGGLP
jgi:hypothetical protein